MCVHACMCIVNRTFFAHSGWCRALQVVADYNANEDVNGILVQLPLPKHIDEQRILDAISLEKDVDGFHPANIGALAMRGRTPLFTSCTPKVPRPPAPHLTQPCIGTVCWFMHVCAMCITLLGHAEGHCWHVTGQAGTANEFEGAMTF